MPNTQMKLRMSITCILTTDDIKAAILQYVRKHYVNALPEDCDIVEAEFDGFNLKICVRQGK